MPAFQWLLAIAIGAVTMVAVMANSFVIFLALTNPSVKRPLSLFLVNLAFADLCLVCTCVPVAVRIVLRLDYGDAFCLINAYVVTALSMTTMLIVASLAMFHYIMVTSPFQRHLGNFHSAVILTAAWLVAWAIGSGPIVHWGHYELASTVFGCDSHYQHRIRRVTFNIMTILASFLLPVVIMIFCYACVLLTLRRQDRRLLHSRHLASGSDSHGNPAQATYRKLVTTVASICAAVILLRSPTVVYLVYVCIVRDGRWTSLLDTLAFWCLYCHCAVNPFIYALRHSEYKVAWERTLAMARRLCCWHRASADHPPVQFTRATESDR